MIEEYADQPESSSSFEFLDMSSENAILLDSDVALAGAEIEVETVEEEEDAVRNAAASASASSSTMQEFRGIFGEQIQLEEDESDLSRFAHDHAYTFSKPPQEPYVARTPSKGKRSAISTLSGQSQRVLGA